MVRQIRSRPHGMVPKILPLVIVGAVAVGLLIGLKHRTPDMRVQERDVEASATNMLAASNLSPTAVDTGSGETGKERRDDDGASSLPGAASVVPRSHVTNIREGAVARDVPTREKEIDTSVIGRPFPVSSSVTTSCRAISGGGDDACGNTWEPLRRMEQEPRDSAWANEMESMLGDHLASGDVGKFRIRAVECRTTICVVEVESMSGPYFGSFDRDAPLFKVLYPGIGAHGYETDPSGTRITVTLMPYTRD